MTNSYTTMRQLRIEDHAHIIQVMPYWWAGRDLTHLLPKLFVVHFQSTCFVVEDKGRMRAFLIGFFSQTYKDEAYIHFVGVDPDYRDQGLARMLYGKFFETCQEAKRLKVRCCTSPINRGSIRFHQKMEFSLEQGDGVIDGFPVTVNHNKQGDHKIQFLKILG